MILKGEKMDQWEKQKIAAICVIVLVCLGLSMWESKPSQLEQSSVSAQRQPEEQEKPQGITVYVSGAVLSPGMYKIPSGSRAVEAIGVAGGLLEDADKNRVNLAKKCKDGTQVNVPFLSAKQKKEKAQDAVYTVAASGYKALPESNLPANDSNAKQRKVNLNTADQKTLESLPGIGPAMAKKIINYRTKVKFTAIEDIMQIPGISTKKFRVMEELLEV